jgi:hypothetical protein
VSFRPRLVLTIAALIAAVLVFWLVRGVVPTGARPILDVETDSAVAFSIYVIKTVT